MRKKFTSFVSVAVLAASCAGSGDLPAVDDGLVEMRVGFALDLPSPVHLARSDGAFDEALGVDVVWEPYEDDMEMVVALAAGDIDIAYALDEAAFLGIARTSAEVEMIGVANTNGSMTACVAHQDLGVTKDNAAQRVVGMQVQVDIGSSVHFRVSRVLDYLGADLEDVEFVDPPGGSPTAEGIAESGVVLACAGGETLEALMDSGAEVLIDEAILDVAEVLAFDVIAVNTLYGEAHSEAVSIFLYVADQAIAMFTDAGGDVSALIASARVGGTADSEMVAALRFPRIEDQLSERWLSGSVPDQMTMHLDFIGESGIASEDAQSDLEQVDIDGEAVLDLRYMRALP